MMPVSGWDSESCASEGAAINNIPARRANKQQSCFMVPPQQRPHLKLIFNFRPMLKQAVRALPNIVEIRGVQGHYTPEKHSQAIADSTKVLVLDTPFSNYNQLLNVENIDISLLYPFFSFPFH